jgi:hypothetical protein
MSLAYQPSVSPFTTAADVLDPEPSPYDGDIPAWALDKAGHYMTEAQQMVCDSVTENRYTAVPSCHDVGKSFTAADIMAAWIDEHPPGEALVVSTAPTWSQVRSILWHELALTHRAANLRGRITEDARWKLGVGVGPSLEVGIGRKPSDYDPSAFQGLHRRYVLVVIDEAGGVPETIFNAVDSLVTNIDCRVLAIGNPDDPASHFAKICRPGSGWNVIHLDALRSPNFTKEELAKYPEVRRLMIREGIRPSKEKIPDRIRPMLVSPLWVDERIKRWGVNSPLFTSKVRGQFPKVTIDTLIPPHLVTAAWYRDLEPVDTSRSLGVDVARYGMDHTIIVERRGGVVRVVQDIAKGPTTETAGLVIRHGWTDLGAAVAYVDDDGVGGGVVDQLEQDEYPVFPMNGGARYDGPEFVKGRGPSNGNPGVPLFVNQRSWWWWRAKEALEGPSGTGGDGWIDLDPADEDLASQLISVKYKINSHGQIEVESKDSMRKRGLPSPDRADAFIMSLDTRLPQNTGQRFVAQGLMVTGDLLDAKL